MFANEFDGNLEILHEIFYSQQIFKKYFEECDQDEVIFMLLTACVCYCVFNKDNNVHSVVAIKKV